MDGKCSKGFLEESILCWVWNDVCSYLVLPVLRSGVWSNEDTSRNSARLGQDVKVPVPQLVN